MMLNINSNYNQKSYLFLYPILNIKRNHLIKPKQTYIHSSEVDISDHTLILEYDLSKETMNLFAKTWLYTNPLFLRQDGDFLFHFGLSVYKDDWEKFVAGKYSKLSNTLKDTITQHYKSDKDIQGTIHSYLYPDKYYKEYSDYYGISRSLLEKVGEVIDPPDLDKEKYL